MCRLVLFLVFALCVPYLASAQPDASCRDVPGWQATRNNVGFDCAWFSLDAYCALFGDSVTDGTYTANQACCTCGGGLRSVPTPTPRTGPSVCVDKRDASDEPARFPLQPQKSTYVTCEWFNPAYRLMRCEEAGRLRTADGRSPAEACCFCGGGDVAPTTDPPAPPTFCDSMQLVTDPAQRLQYPDTQGVSAQYPNNARQCWQFACPRSDQAMRFQFMAFATQAGRDSVSYYTGDGPSYTAYPGLSGLNGELTDDMLDIIVPAPGLLRFASDGSGTDTGFVLEWSCQTGPTIRVTTGPKPDDASEDMFAVNIMGCTIAVISDPTPGSVHTIRYAQWRDVCKVHAYVFPLVVDVEPLPASQPHQRGKSGKDSEKETTKGDRWTVAKIEVMHDDMATFARMLNDFELGTGQFQDGGTVYSGKNKGNFAAGQFRWYEESAVKAQQEKLVVDEEAGPAFCRSLTTLPSLNGRIEYPKQRSYRANEVACWKLALPKGEKRYLNIVVDFLDTEAMQDELAVYVKVSDNSNTVVWKEVDRMSGSEIACLFDKIGYFTRSDVLVAFTSNEDVEGAGFALQYQLVERATPRLECSGVIPQKVVAGGL